MQLTERHHRILRRAFNALAVFTACLGLSALLQDLADGKFPALNRAADQIIALHGMNVFLVLLVALVAVTLVLGACALRALGSLFRAEE